MNRIISRIFNRTGTALKALDGLLDGMYSHLLFFIVIAMMIAAMICGFLLGMVKIFEMLMGKVLS